SEPAFEKLPVIVLSNTYLTGMLQDAWKAGATKCLSKANCTPKQVIEIVRNELSGNGKAPADALAVQPGQAPASNHAHPAATAADVQFQGDLRKSFIEGLPAALSALRALLQGMIKAENEAARLKQVNELSRRIHSLSANAGITGMLQIAQMAEAVEALLKELYEKPKNITASTLR